MTQNLKEILIFFIWPKEKYTILFGYLILYLFIQMIKKFQIHKEFTAYPKNTYD